MSICSEKVRLFRIIFCPIGLFCEHLLLFCAPNGKIITASKKEKCMEKHTLPHDHGTSSESLRSELPKRQTFDTVAALLKLMSDGVRIEIFWLLCHCEECVINISSLIGVTSSVASHHLKLLKTAGLITSRREGKEVYYTSSKTDRAELLHEMIERTVEVACPAEDSHEISVSHDDGSFVSTVNDIHKLLTRDLTRRYTIDELSGMFHINRTTLKNEFKRVFGQSVGLYMKNYRIQRAKELLCHSTDSVSAIASAVGYENQSKFTAAFRDVTGVTPRDYRYAHANMRKGRNE